MAEGFGKGQARRGSLGQAAAGRRLHALFQEITRDFLLREEFVTNPTSLVAEYILKEEVQPATAALTDYVFYAAASNPPLLQRLHRLFTVATPSERDVAGQLAVAAAGTGDRSLAIALVRATITKAEINWELLQWLLQGITAGQASQEEETGTGGPATATATATETATATATETATATATATETATATDTATATETATETATATEAGTDATITFTVTFMPTTDTEPVTWNIPPVTEPEKTSPLTIFTNATHPTTAFTKDVPPGGVIVMLGEGVDPLYPTVLTTVFRYATELRASGLLDELDEDLDR